MARAAIAMYSIDGVIDVYLDNRNRPPDVIVVAQRGMVSLDNLVEAAYVALQEVPGYPENPVVETTVLGADAAEVVAASTLVDRSQGELVAYQENGVAVLTAANFSCAGCIERTSRDLPELAGVLEVEVDRSTRPPSIKASFDPGVATLQSIADVAKAALETITLRPFEIRFLEPGQRVG